MRQVLVSTQNVQRFNDAARALEKRLIDPEIMGLGLVYGRPGLGKTIAMEAYYTRCRKSRRVRVFRVRAMAHWSETGMLKAILRALGQEPAQYRRDLIWEGIAQRLQEPALILIDEVDALAGNSEKVRVLKDIHDCCQSSILMIGEERVDGLLRRFESFYNRMNTGAVLQMQNHSVEDIAAVIAQRCDEGIAVDADVAAEIHQQTGGRSMRSVVDLIREIETFARTNRCERIGIEEFRQLQRQAIGQRSAAPRTSGNVRLEVAAHA